MPQLTSTVAPIAPLLSDDRPTREYLEALVEQVLPSLPNSVKKRLISSARGKAGGLRHPAKLYKLSALEILALSSINDGWIEKQEAEKLQDWHSYLHQLYVKCSDEEDKSIIELAHSKISSSIEHEAEDELDSISGEKTFGPKFAIDLAEKLPDTINWIPRFLGATGGFIYAKDREPNDTDLVPRILKKEDGTLYLVLDSALWLKVRRAFENAFGKEPASKDIRFKAEPQPDGSLEIRLPTDEGPLKVLTEIIEKATGRPVHIVDSRYGSNWPHVDYYDLCLVKRQEIKLEDIHEPGFEELRKEELQEIEKQAFRSAPGEIKRQAEASKKEDKVLPNRCFYPMKPIRSAAPGKHMTEESALDMMEPYLPGYVSKKYDGSSHLFLKDGKKVLIFSDDGLPKSNKLPNLVEEIKAMAQKQIVFIGEIELWKEGHHYPREAANGAIQSGKDLDKLIVNVHDVLYLDGEDIHGKPFIERLKVLEGLKLDQNTMGVPKPGKLFNEVPHVYVKTREQLASALKKLSNAPGSEGIVFDRERGIYRLTGTPGTDRARWKWHKSCSFRATIISAKETKTPGIFVYTYGVPAQEL